MLALGETLPVIGKLLGHNDTETTASNVHDSIRVIKQHKGQLAI